MYLHTRKLALPKTIKALKIVLCLIHILSLDVCSSMASLYLEVCCIFTLANWISMTIWVLYQDIFIYLHIPMIRNALWKERVWGMKERNICCSTFTFDKDRLRNIIWSRFKRRNENEKAINIEMPFHTEYLFQMNCKIMKVL